MAERGIPWLVRKLILLPRCTRFDAEVSKLLSAQ